MASIENITLFEKYNSGKLPDNERQDFEEKLKTNTGFNADYHKYLSVLAAVKSQQLFQEQMQTFNDRFKVKDRSVSGMASAQSSSGGTSVIAILITAIISIALSALVFFFLFAPLDFAENEIAEQLEVEQAEPTISPDQTTELVADTIAEQDTSGLEPEKEPVRINAFMISQSGYFLSQYSKIKAAKSIRLLSANESNLKAEVVYYDEKLDLAILKAEAADVKPLGTLAYRLATTKAGPDTDLMAVYFHNGIKPLYGKILEPQEGDSNLYYRSDLDLNDNCSSAPVISKNGNVVGVVISAESEYRLYKSTELVNWLQATAAQGKIPGYVYADNNRLSGIERPIQLTRMTPFVFRVLLFY
jgi:S1-C subfamily serine protease